MNQSIKSFIALFFANQYVIASFQYAESQMQKRPVIVHFHMFKNAGTSVDSILKANFPNSWTEIEGPNNRKLETQSLIDFIRDNPQLDALSSHTAVVSVPSCDDLEIIPIFFVRHPVDRIRSAYDFERNQDAQTPGAIKAKEGDFKHYLEWRLSTPVPWQIKNFHAVRLKDFHTFTPAKQTHLFLERAHAALNDLTCVGLVERFDESMLRFEKLIKIYFPQFAMFSAIENSTAGTERGLSENLLKFEERIGKPVFDHLREINDIDLKLYEYVKQTQFSKQITSNINLIQ